MSDENEYLDRDEGFLSDSGGFEDFLDNLRPGRKVTMGGQLRYREGGDARDWSMPGQTKRVPGDWMMQIGVRSASFTARTSGSFTITFPQSFVDPPWISACIINTTPAFQGAWVMPTISSAAAMEVYWYSMVNLTYIEVSWIAIGPVGTG